MLSVIRIRVFIHNNIWEYNHHEAFVMEMYGHILDEAPYKI